VDKNHYAFYSLLRPIIIHYTQSVDLRAGFDVPVKNIDPIYAWKGFQAVQDIITHFTDPTNLHYSSILSITQAV
jgi:hypothetical protein